MNGLLAYDAAALLGIAALCILLYGVHKSNLGKGVKMAVTILAGVCITALLLSILFLHAISVGIIGLVPE